MSFQVGAYLRLSRDDERSGESLSIENQRIILTQFVQEHGWELVDTYIDDGLTGTNFDRPEFQRMIEDVRGGRINCVVVKDLSRFGRNYIQIGEYTDYLFPSLGCRFVAINDGIDTLEKENELMPIKNVLNEWYSRDQSKKVKSAKMARANSGFNMCCYAPYGYTKNPDRKPPYFVDETAAPTVRRIFSMRCGGLGYRAIAAILNSEGVTPPRDHYYGLLGKENPRRMNHRWSDKTVKDILSNEAYIGRLVQFKTGSISYKNHKQIRKPPENWVRVENSHEPLVSMELWEKAQALASQSRNYRRTRDGSISLFSGLLVCSDCGQSMKFSRDYNERKDGHRNNHHAYVCGSYSRGGAGACTPHRTRQSVFADLVLEDIREKAARIAVNEDAVIAELKRRKQAATTSEQRTKERNLQALKTRLSELDRLITKLYEEMVLGDIPREVVLEMMEKYKKEQEEKSIQAAELAEQLTHSQEVDHDIREWVSLIRRYVSIEELDRELLIQLVDKIIVGQKTTVNGEERQDITIVYNLVGQVD